MRTLCMGNAWATVRVTGIGCGFNIFLWRQRQLAVCGEMGLLDLGGCLALGRLLCRVDTRPA